MSNQSLLLTKNGFLRKYRDYEYLKESLEVDSDFAFNFKNLAGDSLPELSATKESPTGVERDAQESPVKIIDSSGNLQDRILNLSQQ